MSDAGEKVTARLRRTVASGVQSHAMPLDHRYSPTSALQVLSGIAQLAMRDLPKALTNRGAAPRSAATDDAIFEHINTCVAIGVGNGLAAFHLDLYRDVFLAVESFEKKMATEVHKGSIYFNAAVCALVQHNFDAALSYFEAANAEDAKLGAIPSTVTLLKNPLFGRWVTSKLHAMLSSEVGLAAPTSQLLLPRGYQTSDFESLLQSMPVSVAGSLIIALCRYLAVRSLLPGSDGTRTVRYRLVSDLCIAYEAMLKEWVRTKNRTPSGTLGKLVHADLLSTSLGNISAAVSKLSLACPNMAAYDGLLAAGILGQIDTEANLATKAARLMQFVTFTRNQVTHDVVSTASIFVNDACCTNVIRRVLVAICMIAHL